MSKFGWCDIFKYELFVKTIVFLKIFLPFIWIESPPHHNIGDFMDKSASSNLHLLHHINLRWSKLKDETYISRSHTYTRLFCLKYHRRSCFVSNRDEVKLYLKSETKLDFISIQIQMRFARHHHMNFFLLSSISPSCFDCFPMKIIDMYSRFDK